MVSIFLFSADSGVESTNKSDGIIVGFAQMIVGHRLSDSEREEKIKQYVTVVRKGAHFSIYFLLGFLLINYFYEYFSIQFKSLFLSFLISFLYACSDEVHQLLVVGRSGKILDVLIDSGGAICGILFYSFLILKIFSHFHKKRDFV